MPEIATTEPTSIVAGDTITWKRSLADYPASEGWALSYALVKDGDLITITAAADGDDHLVEVSAVITNAYAVGAYRWQAYVTNSGDRHTVGEGRIEVLPNFATQSSGYDSRSHYEKVVEALRAALEGRASKTQASYSVSTATGSRSISQLSHTEILTALRKYEGLARRERGEVGRGRIRPRFR